MLRVGLTGGIGSGKSTVARRLVERGAVLVDSDVLARAAVAPGSAGLAEVVAAFGERVLDADGALDRPALAAVVFGDDDARHRLNAIVHPRVRAASDALVAAAPPDAVVVQDVPLLVEGGMAPGFPLVVVVHADAQERIRRLVAHRGMPEDDARSRVAAQASDAQRRAVADVWLDNSGPPEALAGAVDALWERRLVPFEANLRARRAAHWPRGVTDADPTWPAQAARLGARLAAAVGARGRGVAHVGPTAVPGLPAVDVLHLEVAVAVVADPAADAPALACAGFVPAAPGHGYASADPGRPAAVAVRGPADPHRRDALLLRDWLRADPAARAACAAAERADDGSSGRVGGFVGSWAVTALGWAGRWGSATGWAPSLDLPGEPR